MKTLIIGGGTMGKTYARSFLETRVLRWSELSILEINPSFHEDLIQNKLGTIYGQADSFIASQELIIFAVKPQDAHAAFEHIRPFVQPNQVALSIMAGVKMDTIMQGVGLSKIIRAMPNLPAQIGMGMTAFTATDEVNRQELIVVQNLLGTTGMVLYFENEDQIDAATAISGSGPAYVYYFMDNMIQAALNLGFNESQAEQLVWQTFMGSVHLLSKKHLTPNEWISKVASKGGTTEAALEIFNTRNIDKDIIEGILAAHTRAVDLGKLTNKQD
ncbi:MAG: pyrroline-5-carboxylate reductase [Chitinophagales bacterium]|nr:pyrroline-5-carboxylate reductase [Bacteroidota bacterium]MCB9042245.1 pyrroline-5-carboxylate reductase [Chitinophagales bacterium]